MIRESCTQSELVPPRSKFPFMVFSCCGLALTDEKKNQEKGFTALKLYSHTLYPCSLVTSTLTVEIQRAVSKLRLQTQGNRFPSLSKASSTEKGFENDLERERSRKAHISGSFAVWSVSEWEGVCSFPKSAAFLDIFNTLFYPHLFQLSPRGYVYLYS